MCILGQELLQSLSYSNRTAAWATASVRSGESLVQVDVHHVESHITRTACAEHRVEVCSVVIHQSAALMHETCNLRNIAFEESERIRVGHHHCCHAVVEKSLQVFHVHHAVGSTLHLHDIKSANGCRSRVRSVCRVRHDDLRTLHVAATLVILADNHQSYELSVCTCKRVQCEVGETGNFRESLTQSVVHLDSSLHRLNGLQRMQMCESRHCGNLLVDGRVILHGAAAERIESVVYAEVVTAVVSVMAHHGHLVTLRQFGVILATHFLRNIIFSEAVLGQRIALASWT